VPGELRRYAAPAGFLLAVTIAVVLIHSALQSSGARQTTATVTRPAKHVETTGGATTTKTRAQAKAAQRFWTVQAGDTFGVISSKSGVPVATIEQLNPNVKSTSLFIGQKLRIK
jgi:LysM repeat protein